jgi:hypothetical protein
MDTLTLSSCMSSNQPCGRRGLTIQPLCSQQACRPAWSARHTCHRVHFPGTHSGRPPKAISRRRSSLGAHSRRADRLQSRRKASRSSTDRGCHACVEASLVTIVCDRPNSFGRYSSTDFQIMVIARIAKFKPQCLSFRGETHPAALSALVNRADSLTPRRSSYRFIRLSTLEDRLEAKSSLANDRDVRAYLARSRTKRISCTRSNGRGPSRDTSRRRTQERDCS